MIYSCF